MEPGADCPVHVRVAGRPGFTCLRQQGSRGCTDSGAAPQLREGGTPSNDAVGLLLGLTPARVAAYRRHAAPSRSLEAPVFGAGLKADAAPLLWADRAMAEDVDVPAAVAASEERGVRADINAALSTLAPRERNVVRMRYGLHRADGHAMNLGEVSAAYGLSKERIRQIEDAALSKLRLPWRRMLLRADTLAAAAEPDAALA